MLATNSTTDFRFSWTPIESASSYIFEILELDTDRIVHTQSNLTVTEFTLDEGIITEDNSYRWQVRAVNNSTSSDFSFRTFEFDTQEPPMAILESPRSTDSLSNNEAISITWRYNDQGNNQTQITSVLSLIHI